MKTAPHLALLSELEDCCKEMQSRAKNNSVNADRKLIVREKISLICRVLENANFHRRHLVDLIERLNFMMEMLGSFEYSYRIKLMIARITPAWLNNETT